MDMVEITGFWELKQRIEYEPPTVLLALAVSSTSSLIDRGTCLRNWKRSSRLEQHLSTWVSDQCHYKMLLYVLREAWIGPDANAHAQDVAVDLCKVTKRLKRRGLIQIAKSEDYERVAQVVLKHDHVFLLSEIPHHWLFPRCSLVCEDCIDYCRFPRVHRPLRLSDHPPWRSWDHSLRFTSRRSQHHLSAIGRSAVLGE